MTFSSSCHRGATQSHSPGGAARDLDGAWGANGRRGRVGNGEHVGLGVRLCLNEAPSVLVLL